MLYQNKEPFHRPFLFQKPLHAFPTRCTKGNIVIFLHTCIRIDEDTKESNFCNFFKEINKNKWKMQNKENQTTFLQFLLFFLINIAYCCGHPKTFVCGKVVSLEWVVLLQSIQQQLFLFPQLPNNEIIIYFA